MRHEVEITPWRVEDRVLISHRIEVVVRPLLEIGGKR